VDDDGQAYLHYGGFSRMIEAKLNDDMISISGKMQEVTPRGFFEAAYLIKRDGKYYEIYAAGSNPATIDYSTSSSPLGPWQYGGRVLDALPSVAGQDASTNHAGRRRALGAVVHRLSSEQRPKRGRDVQTGSCRGQVGVRREWVDSKSDAHDWFEFLINFVTRARAGKERIRESIPVPGASHDAFVSHLQRRVVVHAPVWLRLARSIFRDGWPFRHR